MSKTLIIILVIIILIGIYVWSVYNQLVTTDEKVKNQWAQVETQYQRRYDLIPNLVESVKGIMQQEQEVFNNLAEARTRYAGAATIEDRVKAANEVESALGRLLVILENYPELRSAESVQTLMVQLEGTENRISVERKRFNESVQEFNVMVRRIPGKWIANILGFQEKSYFEAVAGAEQAPEVQF